MSPNIIPTRLKLKNPISPQFIAPIMINTSAILSITFIFNPFPKILNKYIIDFVNFYFFEFLIFFYFFLPITIIFFF